MPDLDRLMTTLAGIAQLRTQIAWLVGLPGSGKTDLLQRLAATQVGHKYVNLNAMLAARLVEEPPEQRMFSVSKQLADILRPRTKGAWLIDNIELLFSRELRLSVVDRLRSIAQQAPLVVAWPGESESSGLIYGARSHPDYREYSLDSAVVVDLNNNITS